MNIFDVGIILLLCMCFIVGWKNGVIKEVVSFIGIIIVFIISYQLKGIIGNILCRVLPFIKFKGVLEGLSSMNILLYQAIAFLVVFSMLLGIYAIVLSVSKFFQKIINLTIILLIPSKILGGIVGVIKGWVVLFVVMMVLLVPFRNQEIFMESKLVNTLLYKTPILNKTTNDFMNATEDIYSLAQKVAKKEITTNEANLRSIDVMLKYKIVDKKTIEELRDYRKLDDIKDLNSVLEKY